MTPEGLNSSKDSDIPRGDADTEPKRLSDQHLVRAFGFKQDTTAEREEASLQQDILTAQADVARLKEVVADNPDDPHAKLELERAEATLMSFARDAYRPDQRDRPITIVEPLDPTIEPPA